MHSIVLIFLLIQINDWLCFVKFCLNIYVRKCCECYYVLLNISYQIYHLFIFISKVWVKTTKLHFYYSVFIYLLITNATYLFSLLFCIILLLYYIHYYIIFYCSMCIYTLYLTQAHWRILFNFFLPISTLSCIIYNLAINWPTHPTPTLNLTNSVFETVTLEKSFLGGSPMY